MMLSIDAVIDGRTTGLADCRRFDCVTAEGDCATEASFINYVDDGRCCRQGFDAAATLSIGASINETTGPDQWPTRRCS